MTETKICFDCGNKFNSEGEGVLCPSCIAIREEREKPKKHRNTRTCIDQIITALGVLVAIFMI